MARCNCSPRCHVCGDGPCDCTCTEADKKARLNQPAQAVDVEAIREVIAEMRLEGECIDVGDWIDKLTAALPNANGKEGWGPKYTAQPCHCLTMAQREYCTNRFKCSTVTTQSTPPQPEE